MSVLDKITMAPLPPSQYINKETTKTQIYIHHTSGSPDPYSSINWWTSTPDRVAVSFLVAGYATPTTKWKDGELIQVFSSKFWGWHLGLTAKHLQAGGPTAKTNEYLNSTGIGIEICSWGQLEKTAQGFKTYKGRIVADAEVCELATPYRGFKYYHKYSQPQLDNTFELIKFLGEKWSIPVNYKGRKMFDVCPAALQGEHGVWTHTSVRSDKNDCFPQPELITMLGAL